MSGPNMLNRVNLQPHLVNLIASLRVHHVQEAVALLLDYVDAGSAESRKRIDQLQVRTETAVAPTRADWNSGNAAPGDFSDDIAALHEPTDAQIDAIASSMPGGLDGFLKGWGWRQFARKVLELRAPPTWEPQFDVTSSKQEDLVRQFCAEIAGAKGEPGRPPDPVRLLEMAQALYDAEREECCP